MAMKRMTYALATMGAALTCLLTGGCTDDNVECSVVVCVPVYGQSLALGEEAQLITDINRLSQNNGMRVVGEGLTTSFGFYDCSHTKRWIKRTIGYENRLYECSAYSMGQVMAQKLGTDTMVCVFAGGQGATSISGLTKGTEPYNRFLEDIRHSCRAARDRGMTFFVPAVCWMQGESDMVDKTDVDYKAMLAAWAEAIDHDIRMITGQEDTVRIICYQSGSMALADDFGQKTAMSRVAEVAQAQMELVRDNDRFVAGSPVYPFSFHNDRLHLDGHGQQTIGEHNGRVAVDIIRSNGKHVDSGLVPFSVCSEGDSIRITMSCHNNMLVLDTAQVAKVDHYGLSVIDSLGNDIDVQRVMIYGQEIVIIPAENKKPVRVRYGINGTKGNSGCRLGARGNIRTDDHRWCYAFDMPVE